ncbi:MAG: hypothetical protein QXD03_03825 [Candidatus Anstonellales archaeon]
MYILKTNYGGYVDKNYCIVERGKEPLVFDNISEANIVKVVLEYVNSDYYRGLDVDVIDSIEV